MLLIFCLVSASLWIVSAEAMTDAISEEMRMIDIGGNTKPVSAGKACNQGCHAQSLLVALDCTFTSANFFLAEEAPLAEYRLRLTSRPQEGPFRPPRATAQA